jgi:di/tricarboxylate transporter
MTFAAGFTLVVVALMITAIAREILSPDVLLFGALVVLLIAGVIDVDVGLAGFGNPAVATVAALFVVAAGLRATGALEVAARKVLGGTRSLRGALARLTVSTAAFSAFVSNTPIVAMAVPTVNSWAQRNRISPSKFLIPVSYASILGGMCTLIGTSTNLVSDGLLRDYGLAGFGFFELAAVGVPCAVVGIAYLVLVSPALLSDRVAIQTVGEEVRKYLAEMVLSDPSPLIGKTIEEAGLRHLPGLFLVRIERSTEVVSPVGPGVRLFPGDILTFAGIVETIKDLRAYPGLTVTSAGRPAAARADWRLHEAVVSPGSPLVGSGVRDADFRARYNAAVIAVHRHGEQIRGRIGDIVLRPGDTLLIEAAPGFTRAYSNSTDFYLVSQVRESAPPRRDLAWRAIMVLAGVVFVAAVGVLNIAVAALAGAIGMVLMGCVSLGEARRSVDWSVLLIIGSALGVAAAMESSGAADILALAVVGTASSFGAVGTLAGLFVAAMILTEVVSNTAAVAIMFPVAINGALTLGVDPRPFVVAVTIAASLSLSTPIGYQTNLIVYGPGGYRFSDFSKVGFPLQAVLAVLCVTLIPLIWPLG